jgi:glycosyltransferase involved in cell wall biosynthesis
MKVLFATNFNYLPQRSGGSESSTHDLCNALIENGIEVAVMSSLGMYDSLWLFNRLNSKLSGQRFISDRRLRYPVFRGHGVKQGIAEVVEKFKPDIVVIQAGYPFELVNAFSKINIPVIFYAHDVEFHKNTEPLKINRYVGCVANSNFTALKLKNILPIDPIVLPPLIDPKKYAVKSTREVVLHIGLNSDKGIETSFALAARRKDIPFYFVESWPISKTEFLDYANRANALGNVKILKRTSDMRKLYGVAKILLAPSIWEEAWGRVITEAQQNGIPAIASNRGGLPESVGSGGLIIPEDAGIDAWENALSSLWDNPDAYLELSQAAQERSQQEDISKAAIINIFIKYLIEHIKSSKALTN